MTLGDAVAAQVVCRAPALAYQLRPLLLLVCGAGRTEGEKTMGPSPSQSAAWRRAITPTRRALRDWPSVRRARTASDLDGFADGYEAGSGYRVDAAYLARAEVFVVVRAGQVVGGFALNVEPPFRTMTRLPELAQRALAAEFPADGTVEMTCVWLAPRARGPVRSAALWATLVWQASRRRRAHVVFGTEVDRLRRLYELTRPRLLYEGEVVVDGRLSDGWVYTISVTRWPLVLLRVVSWRWAR